MGWLINADGLWQFDDSNYTTTPTGVGDLVTGQNTYTFNDKFLSLLEISILDLNGVYRKIEPIDPSQLGMTFEEYFNITFNGSTYTAPSGFPNYYDKVGNIIKLDKAPVATSVTLSKGIRVRFKRTASLFTAVSTTVEDTTVPGFDSTFHPMLAYMASIPYCMTYKKDRVSLYDTTVQRMKKDLILASSLKERDIRKIMTMKKISYI